MFKTFKYLRPKNLLRAENLPIFILVLFFLSEAFTTIAYQSRHSFYNYSLLIKLVFLVVVFFEILKTGIHHKKLIAFLVILSFVFLIGQYSFNGFSLGENFFANSVDFGRYIFVFIVLLFLTHKKSRFSPRLFTVYEKIVIINCLLVLATIIFDIRIFKTYYHRFGSSGVFMTPSMITYFNALALTYFLRQFLLKNKKLFELILISVVCFLSGTKALLFFVFLTLIHVAIFKRIYLKRIFYYALGSIMVIGYVLKDVFIDFSVKNFEPLLNAYNEYGLLAALTSLRSENLKEDFIPVIAEKWGGLNYLFGGTDFEKYRIEFEPFDVFLFFGIIGTLLYFVFYFRNIMNFNKFDSFGKIQMLFLLLTVMVSGNFFNNAPMAMYVLIVISALEINTQNKKETL